MANPADPGGIQPATTSVTSSQPPASGHHLPHADLRGNWYQRIPLPARIVAALALGILFGLLLRWIGYTLLDPPVADESGKVPLPRVISTSAYYCKLFSDVVLRLLGALATPLIFVSVVRSLMQVSVSGRKPVVLFIQLMMNTVVAILVGLLVANIVQPGRWAGEVEAASRPLPKKFDVVEDLSSKFPGSVLKPLAENDIMAVIIIALALGVALRQVRSAQITVGQTSYRLVEDLLDVGFRATLVMLHWIFELVPFAVLAVVARVVSTQGFRPFLALGAFILAVLLALTIQMLYYLVRVWMSSRFTPLGFLRGGADAFLTAFSTASSAATLPITFACAREKMGVSEDSASLGIMVGGTFNHDGTALYEAMAALFIAQMLGMQLDVGQQVLLVIMAVFASVGAAGIPEAGLVTMIAVFTAVGLPPDQIPILLTVDWFLDRCRTAINVMGDLSVTCIVDGAGDSPEVATAGKMSG